MGAAPSTPRLGEAAAGAASPGAAEQMFAALVGATAYPVSSEFWTQLLQLPLTLQWPRDRVLQACHAFGESGPPRDPSPAPSPAVALIASVIELSPLLIVSRVLRDLVCGGNVDRVISACAVVGRNRGGFIISAL
jgi:hypothetical protein